ncbi:hypothetical protein [Schlesneria sp. DSM 10557]|uniref:hypothetical protein n=1 Tax=Schlesneria sp. DSM 10557 TaxID=3044399 RepID=UPI0035A16A1C
MSASNRSRATARTKAVKERDAKGGPAGRALAGNRVADLRKQLQLRQKDFARLLPISVRSLATLEQGGLPTSVVSRRLTELTRLTNALSKVVESDSLGDWLQTPNSAFDGLMPIEVIDRGESDRLWGMIYGFRSGDDS